MEFIFILIVCGVASFFLGWKAREVAAKKAILEMIDSTNEAYKDKIINVYIEKVNNQFFLYNKDTGAFITEVKSKNELMNFIQEKYTDKTVMIKRDDLDLLA